MNRYPATPREFEQLRRTPLLDPERAEALRVSVDGERLRRLHCER